MSIVGPDGMIQWVKPFLWLLKDVKLVYNTAGVRCLFGMRQ